MAAFTIRTSLPGKGDSRIKFYNNGNNGGYSWCINGNPTNSVCNVTANCVGWACSRFNEIIDIIKGGGFQYKTLCCNAENFIERAIAAGLSVSSQPTLGGIMVWQKGATLSGSDGAGHVAIVERIDSSNQVYTSESGYGGSYFWNSTRTNSNGRWGLGSGYTFRGCIVNPAVGKVTTPEPTPTPAPQPTPAPANQKFNIGEKVVINGGLYTNSNAASPVGTVSNKVTTITRYAAGAKHPYNTTGDLGWMDESSISKYSEPTPQPTQRTYTVQRGDNLSKIAQRYGTTWQKIYNDNKAIIGSNPNLIYPGQVLVIN